MLNALLWVRLFLHFLIKFLVSIVQFINSYKRLSHEICLTLFLSGGASLRRDITLLTMVSSSSLNHIGADWG